MLLHNKNIKILKNSLSQQVGKIHEATRLALPTFVDSDSDDSLDDGDNITTLIRPKHLSPSIQLNKYENEKVDKREVTSPSTKETFAEVFFYFFFFLGHFFFLMFKNENRNETSYHLHLYTNTYSPFFLLSFCLPFFVSFSF